MVDEKHRLITAKTMEQNSQAQQDQHSTPTDEQHRLIIEKTMETVKQSKTDNWDQMAQKHASYTTTTVTQTPTPDFWSKTVRVLSVQPGLQIHTTIQLSECNINKIKNKK